MVMDTSLEKEPVDPFAGRKPLDLITPDPHEMRKTPGASAPSPDGAAAAKNAAAAPSNENKEIPERAPIDPFAGRKRLDLFIPEPHEMRRPPINGGPLIESSSRASNDPTALKTTKSKSVTPSVGYSSPEAFIQSPPDLVALLALFLSFLGFTESRPRSSSKLSKLVLTVMLGQNPEWRDSAAFLAFLRITDTQTPMEKIDSELNPILKLVSSAQEAGFKLDVPRAIKCALSFRQELNRRGCNYGLRTDRVEKSSRKGTKFSGIERLGLKRWKQLDKVPPQRAKTEIAAASVGTSL